MGHQSTLDFDQSQQQNDRGFVMVVSGLPRSGTSMMMNILAAGGIEVLTDHIRAPDVNNPQGYFEYERVKQLEQGDQAWLASARGKVVKVISPLLQYLPDQYFYKVIFMQRKIEEILASQQQMLVASKKDAIHINDYELATVYQKHLRAVEAWLATQPNIDVLFMHYNAVIEDPGNQLYQLSDFLGCPLDGQSMLKTVDENLYRQRL
jgi:hypothetical protein